MALCESKYKKKTSLLRDQAPEVNLLTNSIFNSFCSRYGYERLNLRLQTYIVPTKSKNVRKHKLSPIHVLLHNPNQDTLPN